MFVFSVESKKLRAAAIIAAAAVSAAVIVTLIFTHGRSSQPKKTTASAELSYKAATGAERLKFISQFGWEVDEDPAEVSEIIIPEEFDAVYENYNTIQRAQGLDLSAYRGKRVKRWTYTIRNYPGYEKNSDCVRINLLVFDGLVIGGDVCSTELNGFMHGFASNGAVESTPGSSEVG